jgi:23S rRNA (adenine2503-C2)-methyltransferase
VTERLALQALTPEELARVAAIPLADARKIVSVVHRDKPLVPSGSVPRKSLQAVLALGHEPTLALLATERSSTDPFVKLLLQAPDGERIETVRIPLERPGRFSVCVSSQVGCALGCAFCATGRMGLRRQLETWAMVEQVREARRSLARDGLAGRIHGVVFQGMGEPLANLERVLAAIAVMTSPCALQIDARNITVCTAGIPAGIRALARQAPNVRLGLSIGSAGPGERQSLMPIDRAYPLEEVLDAAVEHARLTRFAPLWALTLLAGVNDTEAHAQALAELARSFATRAHVRPRISVVPYNAIGAPEPFARCPSEREDAFRAAMTAAGVATHWRYSGGADVGAACGQLAQPAASTQEEVP